jgi:glycosyltransferase involved in cell wall biosynthesis
MNVDKENTPEISIIMPVYNTEKYVGQAIESVLSQSFKDFEFIIIDDCSTDTSYQICEQYAKKDTRIRLYRNNENKGISYTRNALIDLSQGRYIAIQDSDDISSMDRLHICYGFLEKNPNYAVVSGSNIIIDATWKIIWKRIYKNNIEKIILKKSPVSQASCMFKKVIFEEVGWYDCSLNYWEDYDLWLRMYARGYKIYNLDFVLLWYRISQWQSKMTHLITTLKNTIYIQKRASEKYNMKVKLSDQLYWYLEKILLYFPEKLIFFLFRCMHYKEWK